MDWDEFLEFKRQVDDDIPGGLLIQGPQGDNGMGNLDLEGYVELDNTFQNLFSPKRVCDFVWTGYKVRIHGEFHGGGHPALAGYTSIYCAGRLVKDHFFFHSGHYKPKVEHATYFMCDFVYRSCLAAANRDQMLARLAAMKLRIYALNSSTIHEIDLDTLYAARAPAPQRRSSGSFLPTPVAQKPSHLPRGWGAPSTTTGQMAIPRSTTLEIGRNNAIGLGNTERQISSSPPRPSIVSPPLPSAAMLQSEIGATPTALQMRHSPIRGRARWVPDSERSRCYLCNTQFTTLNRRHHCRKCGDIVCASCSPGRRDVALAAHPPGKDAVTTGVRVCRQCERTL